MTSFLSMLLYAAIKEAERHGRIFTSGMRLELRGDVWTLENPGQITYRTEQIK